jgi:hypothetical protein
MTPALCMWCGGAHPDHRCDSKMRRDYLRRRLEDAARARRLSVAFSVPMGNMLWQWNLAEKTARFTRRAVLPWE